MREHTPISGSPFWHDFSNTKASRRSDRVPSEGAPDQTRHHRGASPFGGSLPGAWSLRGGRRTLSEGDSSQAGLGGSAPQSRHFPSRAFASRRGDHLFSKSPGDRPRS